MGAAAVQHVDAVGIGDGMVGVVQDGDHADTLLRQPPRGGQREMLVAKVEIVGRLVEQQVARARLLAVELSQHAREMYALPLAAREREVGALRQMRDTGLLHRRGGSAQVGAAGIVAHVRRAADQHQLQRGEGEAEARALRQDRAAAAQVARRPGRQCTAVQLHRAFVRLQRTRQAMQQRRLAGAIGAEDGEELARPHRHADPVEDAARAAHDADVVRAQHQNVPFWRSSSQRKNGPPRRAGDDADRQLRRHHDGACEQVG